MAENCEGSGKCDDCKFDDCYYNVTEDSVDYGSLEFAMSESEIPEYNGTKRVA
ncbi:hypothetical protein LCGC14_0938170 [marine sediment metagenome]|uniref:Uncharacterized protein n=1 Tax=marine sediment metagenome TaxID=412755 RepID=A0A0F9R4H2_9ZZZZ